MHSLTVTRQGYLFAIYTFTANSRILKIIEQVDVMQQRYQCIKCGGQLAYGVQFCGNCGTQLNWPTQHQHQPPPTYSSGNYTIQQQGHNENKQQSTVKKKTKPFGIIALVGLILTLIFLVVVCIVNPPPLDRWLTVPIVGAIAFLGIFTIGSFVLLIKYIINKLQINPWPTGAILIVVIAGLIWVMPLFLPRQTSQIATKPPVTSSTPTPPTYTRPSNYMTNDDLPPANSASEDTWLPDNTPYVPNSNSSYNSNTGTPAYTPPPPAYTSGSSYNRDTGITTYDFNKYGGSSYNRDTGITTYSFFP